MTRWSCLRVREAGLLSLVVDDGRPRARAFGVPLGGAADRAALALGNALVGNDANAPALELTLAGPTLEADGAVAAVVYGAPFALSVNSVPIPAGTTFTLDAGDTLRVGGTPHGARGYLCVAGGFLAPEILGSRSALDPLRAGDSLTCPAARIAGRSLPFLMPFENAPPPEAHTLRVLDGPQRDWFDEAFFHTVYEVTPASNRMGLRLRGERLDRRPGEMVSEAVAPGAVQVANDGQPIVLGVDGQTIGGYPKVAHVIRADLNVLARLRPGNRVRFARVDLPTAEAAAHRRQRQLGEWQRRLTLAERGPSFAHD